MAMTYFMLPGNLDAPPSESYFNMVLEGYQEHGVPTEQLFNAVEILDETSTKVLHF